MPKRQINDISIHLTYRCKYNCIFCDTRWLRRAPFLSSCCSEELSFQEIKKILQDAKQCGVYSVNLTGGEPFLRKDIFDIISFCSELDLLLGINTRHTFTQADISRLVSFFKGDLFLSIDSHNSKTAERLAGRTGFFRSYVRGIGLLVKNAIPISTITVLNKLNVREIDKMLNFLCNEGISSVYLRDMSLASSCARSFRPASMKDLQQLTLSPIEIEHVNDICRKWQTRFAFLDWPDVPTADEATKPMNLKPRCSILKGEFNVRPDGKIVYCSLAHDLDIGDLRRQNFKSFLKSASFKRLINPSRSAFKGTECYNCNFFALCNTVGRCYKRNFILHGDFFKPDDKLCSVLKETNHHNAL